jgi:L-rhamnose mutarotase
MRNRYCLALDLKNDPELIAAYDAWHQKVWPEIIDSIREAGVEQVEIYRVENRLFMILETGPGFRWEHKVEMDAANPKVQEWEELMWHYQQALPTVKPGEKWALMQKVFEIK